MFGQSELRKMQIQQEGKIKQLEQTETETKAEIEALSERCRSLEKRVDYLEEYLSSYENALINIRNNNARLDLLEQNMERSLVKVKKLEKGVSYPVQTDESAAQTGGGAAAEVPLVPTKEAYNAIDYFDFENHFRGSREVIKQRQKQYLSYFSECKNVIDIGCGRGEFLELLKENDIKATGVDTYDEFVEYCKERGLSAVCDDGSHYLKSVDSTDGIFIGQVVEHLKEYQIVDLCNTAFEKMKSGSYLIIETPNPTSLAIYTHAFYVDPSHVKPVHPLTMEYFLQKAGFKDIKIIYTENSRVEMDIPELHGAGIENLETFNEVMKQVSSMLFGSQDYAIIARK